MAGIDFDAMREKRKERESTSSNASFLDQKDVGEVGDETVFRLTPIPDSNQSLPYFEEKGYWINGSRYVSPESFGDPCPIREEIEEAKASGDKSIFQLLQSRNFSEKSSYLFVGVELEVEWQKAKIADWKVVDDTVKFLQTTVMLADSIEDVFYQRRFQNDSEHGIADLKKGFPLLLSKKKETNLTRYKAEGVPQVLPLDDKYAETPEAANLVRSKVYSEEYLRQVIRNYLWGEPITAEKGKYYEKELKPTSRGREEEPENTKEKEPDVSTPSKPPSKAEAKESKKSESKSSNNALLDDLGDIGDLPA